MIPFDRNQTLEKIIDELDLLIDYTRRVYCGRFKKILNST